ncbi:hypothetical protein CPHO_10180 [Corynebacterium phocae]|uniref:DUF3037 domain-containing protein n=1 Tax=Corynebacterium phocae TaxID=161895 RepID=A0A1L7D4Z4_9CORY|nr:DUF3037 domain-containing protein [Corynebacterium phocae]APT93195.1 hypothetical protein CPHO_10180 [Corynebacterium phocae]KAA8721932.1 DUF3037 domain-containing protein [Corynebacterium phocae]
MKFNYWTVRVKPTPASVTRLGVGVIVGDSENNSFGFRFLNTLGAKLRTFPSSRGAQIQIAQLKKMLQDAANEEPTLDLQIKPSPRELLNLAVERWNNLVLIDPPNVVSANSLEEAADFLFDKLIFPGESRAQPERVRATVKNCYRGEARLRQFLVSEPRLILSDWAEQKFDVGVVKEDQVLDLNRVLSLDTQSRSQLSESLQVFTYRMQEFREDGAELKVAKARLVISKDVPVVLTTPAQDPAHTLEHNLELLSTYQSPWANLGIKILEVEHLATHVASLAQKV